MKRKNRSNALLANNQASANTASNTGYQSFDHLQEDKKSLLSTSSELEKNAQATQPSPAPTITVGPSFQSQSVKKKEGPNPISNDSSGVAVSEKKKDPISKDSAF